MINVLLFLFGIHLTIVLFAACYRIIDLWYAFEEHAANIALRLVVIVSVTCFTYFVLPPSHESAVMWGQLSFTAFHITAYWLGIIWLKMRSRA
jgi:hypothetical protein